jgi:peptidoglycan hydrolase-like protein with peptidoglycan-binding domain
MAVQRALADLGYAPGPVDGIAGPSTTSAIRRYQAAAGLPVNGEISPALLEDLRSNPVPMTAGSLPPPDTGREVAKGDVVINGKDMELPPLYETGDAFAWSNGLVETVIRIDGDRIFWRGSDGASFNADRNFVMPPSSWDQASGPGSATVSVNAEQLWPFRQGRRFNFWVLTTGPSGTESERDWTCSPQGRKKVTVPAGTFDTQVITCGRSAASDGEWRYRTWFYAPAVRHYVRRVDRFSDGSIQAIA